MKNLFGGIIKTNSAGMQGVAKEWVLKKADNSEVGDGWWIQNNPSDLIIEKESDGKYGIYIKKRDREEPVRDFRLNKDEKIPDWMSNKYIEHNITDLTIHTQYPNIDIARFKNLHYLRIEDFDLAGKNGVLDKLRTLTNLGRVFIKSYTSSKKDIDLRDFGKVATQIPFSFNNYITLVLNDIIIGDYLPSFSNVRCEKMILDLNNPNITKHTPSLFQCIIKKIEFANLSQDSKLDGINIENCRLDAEDIAQLKELCKDGLYKIDNATLRRSGVLKKGDAKDILGQPITAGDVVAIADANRPRFGSTGLFVGVYKVDKVTDARISAGGHFHDPSKVLVLDKDWIKKRDINNKINL